MNLSYKYNLEYYDGTQFKTYCYVYRILPYPSQCGAGYETLTGLINSCTLCPRGTYKTDNSASRCVDATGLEYVGLYDLVDRSDLVNGLGGIGTSTAPNSPGIEMLISESGGGNYGYKLKAGYKYTADTSDISECNGGFSEEQVLQDNLQDNTDTNFICDSCPDVSSGIYSDDEKIGLLRTETDPSLLSTGVSDCAIKVCDEENNYMNIDNDPEKFCKLKNCERGYYFDETVLDGYGKGKCVLCPVGHYCDGTTDEQPDHTVDPSILTHQKNECPMNTYNPNTGSWESDDCERCPDFTITKARGASSVDECILDDYYGGTPDEPECLPGTIPNEDEGTCEDPGTIPSGTFFPGTGEYTCSVIPDDHIELATCDIFKDRTVVSGEELNMRQIFLNGERYVQCIRGYEPKRFEDLDFTDQINIDIIDNISTFYLYEYTSFRKDTLEDDNIYLNDDNYYLNDSDAIISIIETALNNNLTFNSTDNNDLREAIKAYRSSLASYPDKKLLYYKDIIVYKNNSDGSNKKFVQRYIYGILPHCDACPSGFTSDGYAPVDDETPSCTECSNGYQGFDGNERVCIYTCQEGEYFDGSECQLCPEGTFCSGDREITTDDEGGWLPKQQVCSENTYCDSIGLTAEKSCPTNTQSPAGSTRLNQCIANAGFYGPPGEEPTTCPENTQSTAGATRLSDCMPIDGYFGPSGQEPIACPGNKIEGDSNTHQIFTESNNCVYKACPDGFFRNNQGSMPRI